MELDFGSQYKSDNEKKKRCFLKITEQEFMPAKRNEFKRNGLKQKSTTMQSFLTTKRRQRIPPETVSTLLVNAMFKITIKSLKAPSCVHKMYENVCPLLCHNDN